MSQVKTPQGNSGLVKFGGITAASAAKSRKAVKSGRANFFKFKMGTNLVRFLPPPEGEDKPWVITHQHYLRNWAGGKKALIFNCPLKAGEGACPACQKADELMGTGNAADKTKAEDLRPRPRVFANIIDRKDEEAGVQIAAFGSMILDQMCEYIEDPELYGADFTHPFSGDDLAIKRSEKGGRTEYKVNIRTGDNERLAETEDQMIKWLETAPNLNPYTEILTYEQIVAAGQALQEEAQGSGGGGGGAQQTQAARQITQAQPKAQPKAQPVAAKSKGFGDTGLESAAAQSGGEADNSGF